MSAWRVDGAIAADFDPGADQPRCPGARGGGGGGVLFLFWGFFSRPSAGSTASADSHRADDVCGDLTVVADPQRHRCRHAGCKHASVPDPGIVPRQCRAPITAVVPTVRTRPA